MNNQIKCKYPINKYALIRLILTVTIIVYTSIKYSNHKYIYLIVPLLLSLLDSTDGSFFYFKKNRCYKEFQYQILDKINDSFAYLLVFFMIPMDTKIRLFYLLFLIWRIIGVTLFGLTKKSVFLITMPDLIKEFMVYIFLFKSNFTYLPVLIIGKIIFEFIMHSKINKLKY